jgi:putative oxidoreductase
MLDHIRLLHLLTVAALSLALYQTRRLLPAFGRLWSGKHWPASSNTKERRKLLLLELTEVTLAAIFFLVGGAKLAGQQEMIRLFRDIGLGEWFRYLTGMVEVSGALLLVVPVLSGASAIALGAVMIVASIVELFVLHRPPIAALACLAAHTFVAWSRVSSSSAPAHHDDAEGVVARSELTVGEESDAARAGLRYGDTLPKYTSRFVGRAP